MSKVLGVTAVGPGKEYTQAFLGRAMAQVQGVSEWWVALDEASLPVGLPEGAVLQPLGAYDGPPDPRRYGRIARMREAAREYFLLGDWTHLFFLDCDIIAPAATVLTLLGHNRAVASGAYVLRDNSLPQLPVQYEDPAIAKAAPVKSVVNYRIDEGDPIFEVLCSGMGCMLIDRSTLERVPFRPPAFFTLEQPDGEDYQWCYDAGEKVLLDAGVCCWHVSASGLANQLVVGEVGTTATYQGSVEYVTTRHGVFARGVPVGGLTAEQIGTLGPEFKVEQRHSLSVIWRPLEAILP
jgi:hypothetical protein